MLISKVFDWFWEVHLIRSQTPYQIVLTKTDIVFPIDVARRAMQIQEVKIYLSSQVLFDELLKI